MTEKIKDSPSNKSELKDLETQSSSLKDAWSIRPCHIYKEEYDDCTSIKARFHQYFIHGQNTDCSQWQTDYNNCKIYEKSNFNDTIVGTKIIESEKERRLKRLSAHYGNDVWKKREKPPSDWDSPLPEWLLKRNENSYLELKQMELEGRKIPEGSSDTSYCTIM